MSVEGETRASGDRLDGFSRELELPDLSSETPWQVLEDAESMSERARAAATVDLDLLIGRIGLSATAFADAESSGTPTLAEAMVEIEISGGFVASGSGEVMVIAELDGGLEQRGEPSFNDAEFEARLRSSAGRGSSRTEDSDMLSISTDGFDAPEGPVIEDVDAVLVNTLSLVDGQVMGLELTLSLAVEAFRRLGPPGAGIAAFGETAWLSLVTGEGLSLTSLDDPAFLSQANGPPSVIPLPGAAPLLLAGLAALGARRATGGRAVRRPRTLA